MPRDIDLDLLTLDEAAAQRWLATLRHQMPWLAAHEGVPPSRSLLKAVGTRACISHSHQLELSVVGTFGDEARMLVRKDDWTWR